MKRRCFLSAAVMIAASLSRIANGQSNRLRRIGFLSNGSAMTGAAQMAAFGERLRELGWNEGQNIAMEYRWADGHPERLPGLVAELVEEKVDVIFLSGVQAIAAAQKATSTVPIVFVLLTDPVEMRFVQSLARPGGNMTGLSSQFEELITKQLQLLKEAVPSLSRVALLRHSEASPAVLKAAETAARSLGLFAQTLTVTSEAEFERAFVTARRERVGAIHVLPSPYLGAQRRRLIELAAQYRLPAFYELRIYVQDGGLMCYGPSINDLYGRAASYVDRILKGANPGNLAIERPSRFELVINLKTAASLGLVIPPSLLARADELIA